MENSLGLKKGDIVVFENGFRSKTGSSFDSGVEYKVSSTTGNINFTRIDCPTALLFAIYNLWVGDFSKVKKIITKIK